MKHYLILDKTNLIVKSFTNKKEAEKYVEARQYLKVSEFDDSQKHTSDTLNAHRAVTDTDDLPF